LAVDGDHERREVSAEAAAQQRRRDRARPRRTRRPSSGSVKGAEMDWEVEVVVDARVM
jgi:hypothetical protein